MKGGEKWAGAPHYLLHGCGHSRGTELLLCHPAGWGRGRLQGDTPIQGKGVDHVCLVDVREDMDNLRGDGKTHGKGSWQVAGDEP